MNKFYILFQSFYCRFWQASKHLLCIGSILSPISSRVHNAANQALQWVTTRATSENFMFFFLENNNV